LAEQATDVGIGGESQALQIVATLQQGDQTALAVVIGEVGEHCRELAEVVIPEKELAERIPNSGVEPGRDQDEIGAKFPGSREKQFTKSGEDFRRSAAGRQRAVDRLACSRTVTCFIRRASARVPGRLVSAEKKNTSIGIEDILCAVAVVHIPVRNQNAFRSMSALGIARCDSNAIEEAETHAARATGVVSGRPHNAEGVLDFTGEYGVDG
jgi:hypothetical protein